MNLLTSSFFGLSFLSHMSYLGLYAHFAFFLKLQFTEKLQVPYREFFLAPSFGLCLSHTCHIISEYCLVCYLQDILQYSQHAALKARNSHRCITTILPIPLSSLASCPTMSQTAKGPTSEPCLAFSWDVSSVSS